MPVLAKIDQGFFEVETSGFSTKRPSSKGSSPAQTGRASVTPQTCLSHLATRCAEYSCRARTFTLTWPSTSSHQVSPSRATEQMPEFFIKMLAKRRFQLIDVPSEGVFKHYCNIQCLGDDRVLTFAGNTDVNRKLKALGLEVVAPEITQILKGGGGPHCMTFPLLRDA